MCVSLYSFKSVEQASGGSQGLGKQFSYEYFNDTERTKIFLVSRSKNIYCIILLKTLNQTKTNKII